jgi:hypothetical protein
MAEYPHRDGDVWVIGPYCISNTEEPTPNTALNWLGAGFVYAPAGSVLLSVEALARLEALIDRYAGNRAALDMRTELLSILRGVA